MTRSQLQRGELVDADQAADVVLPPAATLELPDAGLGAAAERFARNTLRKSAQTQRTYVSVYRRFAAHLADQTGETDPGPDAMTADTVAGYLDALEALGRSKATVRKERAALNRLTRHLQLIGAIDRTVALEILAVEASTRTGTPQVRPALDEQTWQRVKDRVASRVLELSPTGRATTVVATRDLAIVVCLGELGLRSEELRTLRLTDLAGMRARSATPWLHVVGKGARERDLPLPAEVQRALLAWLDVRPVEADWNPLLFPRLGRQRIDGTFPDARQRRDKHDNLLPAAPLSATSLVNIVAPVMLAAGVPADHCHPHVLRHTFATLFLRRRAHDTNALTKLQDLLGHASIETTRGYGVAPSSTRNPTLSVCRQRTARAAS